LSRWQWVAMAACAAPLLATASESPSASLWSFKHLAELVFPRGSAESEPARLAQAPAKPAAPALPLPESVSVPPPPRFDIQRFDVQGNSLLSSEQVEQAVRPYTGASKDFADVQRALEALQIAYQERGYATVQVVLPEQELEQGVIVLRVLEPKLGKVSVEGNKHFDQANIRRSLPALREGATPNATEIARDVRLANENPAKRMSVLLRAGANEGEVDAVARVQDEKTWRGVVSYDNTGTPTSGKHRLGIAYQESNLFNLDNVFTLQYQLDPEPLKHFDDLKILGMSYQVPLYGLHSSVDFLFGYSDLGPANGQVIQGLPFNIAGSGTIFGVRYNYLLPRPSGIEEYDHRISFGVDYKSFTNAVREVIGGTPGANLTPDVTVYPFSIAYSATKRMENAELGFFGSVAKNFFPQGPDAEPEVFRGPNGVRPGVGEPRYLVWRYGINYVRALPKDFQIRGSFLGQYTNDALVPGEQFGIGGWDSVRGLTEREGASDRGWRASFEVYSPDFAPRFGIEGGNLRFLAFFDHGDVRLNHRDAAEPCGATGCGFSATSAGFGIRMSLRQGLNLRVDYGHLLNGGVTSGSGSDRVHFGVGLAF